MILTTNDSIVRYTLRMNVCVAMMVCARTLDLIVVVVVGFFVRHSFFSHWQNKKTDTHENKKKMKKTNKNPPHTNCVFVLLSGAICREMIDFGCRAHMYYVYSKAMYIRVFFLRAHVSLEIICFSFSFPWYWLIVAHWFDFLLSAVSFFFFAHCFFEWSTIFYPILICEWTQKKTKINKIHNHFNEPSFSAWFGSFFLLVISWIFFTSIKPLWGLPLGHMPMSHQFEPLKIIGPKKRKIRPKFH